MSINANNAVLNEILEAINELPISKDEQTKAIDITENGTTVVTPDEGMTLGEVTVNVDVPSNSETVPVNAVFKVDKYTEEGYPLEVSLNSQDGISTPEKAFCSNYNYIGSFWKKIEKVNLPSTITTIGNYGLAGLSNLKKVTNWDNIEDVSESGFMNTNLSQHDYLPPKLTVINRFAFNRTSIKFTEFPPAITHIGDNAFAYCGSTDIKSLPPNLISVGASAFSGNSLIVSFSEIPATVQTIGTNAFDGACRGIKGSLVFKGTPVSIASNAFSRGTNITDIYVPWPEGTVANAPWGATNAAIHYNSEV